jgi:hypothetical protein
LAPKHPKERFVTLFAEVVSIAAHAGKVTTAEFTIPFNAGLMVGFVFAVRGPGSKSAWPLLQAISIFVASRR